MTPPPPQSSSWDVLLQPPHPPHPGTAAPPPPVALTSGLGRLGRPAAPGRPPGFATPASRRRGPRGRSPRGGSSSQPRANPSARPAPAAGSAPTPRRAPRPPAHLPPSTLRGRGTHAPRTDVSPAHRPSPLSPQNPTDALAHARSPSPGRKWACPRAATPPGKCSPPPGSSEAGDGAVLQGSSWVLVITISYRCLRVRNRTSWSPLSPDTGSQKQGPPPWCPPQAGGGGVLLGATGRLRRLRATSSRAWGGRVGYRALGPVRGGTQKGWSGGWMDGWMAPAGQGGSAFACCFLHCDL